MTTHSPNPLADLSLAVIALCAHPDLPVWAKPLPARLAFGRGEWYRGACLRELRAFGGQISREAEQIDALRGQCNAGGIVR